MTKEEFGHLQTWIESNPECRVLVSRALATDEFEIRLSTPIERDYKPGQDFEYFLITVPCSHQRTTK